MSETDVFLYTDPYMLNLMEILLTSRNASRYSLSEDKISK